MYIVNWASHIYMTKLGLLNGMMKIILECSSIDWMHLWRLIKPTIKYACLACEKCWWILRSRLFWRKKNIMHARDATFWPKRNTAMNYKYSCYTRNRWFSWVVDMTSNIHLKKNQRVTLIDYGFFFKIRNNATDFISLKTYSDFIID